MQHPHLTYDELMAAVDKHGSQRKAAAALGIPRSTLGDWIRAKEPFLDASAKEQGFPAEDVSGYWVKSETGSFYVRRDTSVDYGALRDDFLREASRYAPKYRTITHRDGEHLLIIDPADVHIGKLSLSAETGHNYNIADAVEKVHDGVLKLLSQAMSFGIEQIVFVLGNDILHIDTPHRKTTSGTPQDTEGQWWSAYRAAKELYVKCIEACTQVAPVRLVHCPSNHDYKSGWMLADSVSSWFRNNPNVILRDSSLSIAHRKYLQYGVNLLGFSHGDGAKEADVAQIMQYEARKEWGETHFAYFFEHHFHHKDRKSYGRKGSIPIEKDHTGVTVIRTGKGIDAAQNVFTEVIRSPSPPDGWHHRNGYLNRPAIEAFIHHHEDGQVARLTTYV